MTFHRASGSGRLSIIGSFTVSGPTREEDMPSGIVSFFKQYPTTQQVAVNYANSEGNESQTVFSRFTDDENYVPPVEKTSPYQLSEEAIRAWFITAGFKDPKKIYHLKNEYDPWREDPWWLVKTELGFIKIGWRSKVLVIDWSDTDIRVIVTQENVTKDETFVHAWDVLKAIGYLINLRLAWENSSKESPK